MVDTRFHPSAGPASLGALLAATGRGVNVDADLAANLMIAGADELGLAGRDQIALAAHHSYAAGLRITSAGAVIVSAALSGDVPKGSVAIVAERPHDLFADLLELLYPGDTRGVVVALMARSDTEPFLEDDVRIGANVVLGPGVEVGRGTVIGPNTVIGAGVAIGRNCTIASNCSIECAYLGNDVVLHAGARIGTEGFGWLDHGRTNRKIPQLGRVIVQDRVEIGANSTVDRGALGDTVIGEGTKIDNLVQIGHNCRIGRNCLLAGMVGLAGSTILGDGVLIGGAAATTGHITIGSGSVLSACCLVTKDVPAGAHVGGYPARDLKTWQRELAVVHRLSKGDGRGR